MILRYIQCVVFLLLAVCNASPVNASPNSAGEKGLIFGSGAIDIPSVMYRRLKPLTDYLASELKRPVTLRMSSSLSSTAEDLASGSIDIAYLTPVAYLKAHKMGNARAVVKIITKGKSSLTLKIVVRRDSPIKSVNDLIGKTFAFGDPAALLQRAVVVNAGIKLQQLGSYRFVGRLDNIARGVADGDFDAGILQDTIAYDWEKKGLRIIYTSPELPTYNISVSSRIPDALFIEIQRALLKLNSANPKYLKIIESLDNNYNGFAKTSDADYDLTRKLIKPFE
ncbi:MAG: PhnD/SsuA/transferrin family substrate-binding protein [Sulfuricaulis sp.]